MEVNEKIQIKPIIKAFWQGIKPRKKSLIGSYFLFEICYILGLFIPIYYKKFFDVLGKATDKSLATPELFKIIVVVLSINLIVWIIFRIGLYFLIMTESLVMARLKQNSFDYIIDHSHNFFANHFTGSLVQRINRFARAFETISDTIAFNLLSTITTIIGSIVITAFIAPFISKIILIWVVIFAFANYFYSRWKLKYDIISSKSDSRTTAYLADSITNSNSIMSFSRQKFESKGFSDVAIDQAKKMRLTWFLSEIFNSTLVLMIVVVEFFVFWWTLKNWSLGLATIGTFVLGQTYIITLSQQFWGLHNIVRKIFEALADSKEIVDILNTEHEVKNIPHAKEISVLKGEIELKDVVFNFNETRAVISNLNMKIKAGEKIAIIGPSGAGKTTLARLIMRFYDVFGGEILIDGQNIAKVTQESLRENISFVPQDPVLFHRTLLENIKYGKLEASDEEVYKAAKLAHCDEFVNNLPLKYDTYVGERGIKLSGGERQRIAIARAILKHAPILILDEATSSLDSHSESLIQDALNNLMKNCTTIVIAHRLSTIKMMDRIISMQNGKIIEEGTHEELSNKEGGLYKKLWTLQAGGFIIDEE